MLDPEFEINSSESKQDLSGMLMEIPDAFSTIRQHRVAFGSKGSVQSLLGKMDASPLRDFKVDLKGFNLDETVSEHLTERDPTPRKVVTISSLLDSNIKQPLQEIQVL